MCSIIESIKNTHILGQVFVCRIILLIYILNFRFRCIYTFRQKTGNATVVHCNNSVYKYNVSCNDTIHAVNVRYLFFCFHA